jgi:hypothetical protein
LPWQNPTAPSPPPPTSPHNPYVTADDAFPTGSPFAQPVDPAAIAAEHEAARDEEPAPARAAGAHRVRRGPMRYVLPALLGAVVVVAIGIGLSGWISSGTPGDQAGTGSSQVHVSPPHSSATAGSPSSPAATSPASSSPSAVPTKPKPKPTPSRTGPAKPPVVHAPVVVLNETTERGLAARVGAHLTSLGWTVTGVGNWRGNISTSTVYYPPGDLAAARSLAYDLGISRLRPRVGGMLTDRLTVVLTSDPLA